MVSLVWPVHNADFPQAPKGWLFHKFTVVMPYKSIPAEIGLKSNNFYLEPWYHFHKCGHSKHLIFLLFSAFVVCVAPFAFTRFEYIFWANKWYCLLIMHISFSCFDASLWKHCTLLCQIIQYLTLYESVADFFRSSLNQWPKWQNVLFVHALLNDTKTSQLTGWHRYKSHAQTLDQLHLLPS